MIKRALISVYNKIGVLGIASFLKGMGTEIISTGGTFKYLRDNGIPSREVSEVTGCGEMLGGRVKSPHPFIHGGILARRDNKEDITDLGELGIGTIDLVIVNLYPFFEKSQEDISLEEKLEFIDIGGPTMLRGAAKNFKDVIVLSDPMDYERVIGELKSIGEVSINTRRYLAGRVFNLMSSYDAAISSLLLEAEGYAEFLSLSYRKEMDLRYGENPHQNAAYYIQIAGEGAMKDFVQLKGKELSYNNIRDMDIAWKIVNEFDEICCCGVKHNTPCGAALGDTVKDAYLKTSECDPVSIFGGIVAFNRRVDLKTAEELVKTFFEVVIAPEFDEDALEVLQNKKNLRIIKCSQPPVDNVEITSVDGGILVQQRDKGLVEKLEIVTEKNPGEQEMKELIFGMKVVKYVKSDAFFPFGDVALEASKHGIRAIIQPGGSIRDNESIEACNEHGIAMVFTGMRHFKH